MKTSPWKPVIPTEETSFSIDDSTIFICEEVKLEKRTTLLSAMVAGASYASMGLPFQVLNGNQEIILQFEPGTEVEGYPALKAGVLELAVHVDLMVRAAVDKMREGLKVQITEMFAELVDQAVQAELVRLGALNALPAEVELAEAIEGLVSPVSSTEFLITDSEDANTLKAHQARDEIIK